MKKGFMVAAAIATAAGLPAAWADEGMVVVRDAETGALRAPTAAEAAALNAKSTARADRQAPEVRLRRLPGGGIAATVPESLMQYSMVQRRADGTLERMCAQGDEQAQAAALPAFAERIKTVSTARTVRGMKYEDR